MVSGKVVIISEIIPRIRATEITINKIKILKGVDKNLFAKSPVTINPNDIEVNRRKAIRIKLTSIPGSPSKTIKDIVNPPVTRSNKVKTKNRLENRTWSPSVNIFFT